MSEWTDQRIELLKELWLEGATSTEICARLDISRSAVLGKIKRLGLNRKVLDAKEHAQAAKSAPEAATTDAMPKAPVQRETPVVPEPPAAFASRNRTPPPLDMLAKTFSAASSLGMQAEPANTNGKARTPKKHLSIWELRDGCCKWPMGELLDRPEFFCGAATTIGSPWCEYHRSIAFPRDQVTKRAQPASPPPGFRGSSFPKIGR